MIPLSWNMVFCCSFLKCKSGHSSSARKIPCTKHSIHLLFHCVCLLRKTESSVVVGWVTDFSVQRLFTLLCNIVWHMSFTAHNSTNSAAPQNNTHFFLIIRKTSPKRVAFIGLLDCLDDSLVYPKADGHRKQGQGNVSGHAHDAEHC